MPGDRNYIELLKQADEQAFRKLIADYQDKIHNTCIGILQSREDAEEMTQEVFVEVFRSINKFKGDSSLSTWLYRIAVNKSLELLRSRKRKKRFAPLLNLFSPGSTEPVFQKPDFVHPGVQLEKKEMATVLFAAIDKLPERQRAAFVLFHVEGLSYNEIRDVMGLSLSSVESLMHRAKENLKELLGDYYEKNVK